MNQKFKERTSSLLKPIWTQPAIITQNPNQIPFKPSQITQNPNQNLMGMQRNSLCLHNLMGMQRNSLCLHNLMGMQRWWCGAIFLEIDGVVGEDVKVWVEACGEVGVLVGEGGGDDSCTSEGGDGDQHRNGRDSWSFLGRK